MKRRRTSHRREMNIVKDIAINAELTIEDELDMTRPLLHARKFPAIPIVDEDDELCGVSMPPVDWKAFCEAMKEIGKLAKPMDRIVTRFHASEDREAGAIEIGIMRCWN
jgi:hypothetical protein